MIAIQLDPATHDIDLSQRTMTLSSGNELLRQRIIQKLRLIQGEWFLNRNIGLPWNDILRSKRISEAGLQQFILQALASVQGVETVDALDVLIDARERTASISFSVNKATNPLSESVNL